MSVRQEFEMQTQRKLGGAAKAAGKILLFGKAYWGHLLTQEGLAAVREPLQVGEQVAETIEGDAVVDAKTAGEDEFEAVDRRLDGERVETPDFWEIVRRQRETRKRVNMLHKMLGRQKLDKKLTGAVFETAIKANAAAEHHEVTKQDLKRFQRGEVGRKPLPKKLRGDPANIPARRREIEERYPLERLA